jgi:hypothetical protein
MSLSEDKANAIQCPICGGAAERGTLYGQSTCLKWLPWSKSLFLSQWAIGATTVGRSGFRFPSGRSQAHAILCLHCNRLIIDSDQLGVERVHFTIQSLLSVTAIMAGGFAGAVLLSRTIDTTAGILFGFPLGLVLGWMIGIGLLRSLEYFFPPRSDRIESD